MSSFFSLVSFTESVYGSLRPTPAASYSSWSWTVANKQNSCKSQTETSCIQKPIPDSDCACQPEIRQRRKEQCELGRHIRTRTGAIRLHNYANILGSFKYLIESENKYFRKQPHLLGTPFGWSCTLCIRCACVYFMCTRATRAPHDVIVRKVLALQRSKRSQERIKIIRRNKKKQTIPDPFIIT